MPGREPDRGQADRANFDGANPALTELGLLPPRGAALTSAAV